MTWTRSTDRLQPKQRIRWGGNEYKVKSVGAGSANVKHVKGPDKRSALLPISPRSCVERWSP